MRFVVPELCRNFVNRPPNKQPGIEPIQPIKKKWDMHKDFYVKLIFVGTEKQITKILERVNKTKMFSKHCIKQVADPRIVGVQEFNSAVGKMSNGLQILK